MMRTWIQRPGWGRKPERPPVRPEPTPNAKAVLTEHHMPTAAIMALDLSDEDIDSAGPALKPGLVYLKAMGERIDPYIWHLTSELDR